MPSRYVIDAERKLVISAGWGRVTFAEMKAHQDQLVSDPDFNPDFRQLVDGTAVTELDMSTDEAKTIASRIFFSPTSRCAFLASGLSILAMARLMEMYSRMATGREQVSVFYDRKSAMEWLGLEDDREPMR